MSVSLFGLNTFLGKTQTDKYNQRIIIKET